MSTIEVPYHDEAYDMLIKWVASQPFALSARTSLAMVDIKRSANDGPGSHANKKALRYSPCNGRFYFWHKYYWFVFKRNRTQGEFGGTREEVSISYFGWNPNILKGLLDECRLYYLEQTKNKTCIFEHEGDRWKSSKPRNKRSISTVFINEDIKGMLLQTIADFLDPATRLWYASRGLPYQQGLLFYGPPGTGKSSFTHSIAGQFDLDVYVLTMSSLGDHSLQKLFAELPKRCIVLLEDVDAVGLKRTQNSKTDSGRNMNQDNSHTPAIGKVTLSTLLNVLDGLGSSEGRLLIMTTNHIERLDPALIRPGRVDMKVEFQLADAGMISQLFSLVYDPQQQQAIESENELGQDHFQLGKMLVTKDRDLEQLAQEFMAKVPKLDFSPAEILSHLLANKRSPSNAVASVETWIETTREEREKIDRASSWGLGGSDGFLDE